MVFASLNLVCGCGLGVFESAEEWPTSSAVESLKIVWVACEMLVMVTLI